MKPEILNYLQKIDGGDWSTKEKKQKLYDLVNDYHRQFRETPLLSVELGVFAGSCLFPIAHAHKDLGLGVAIGIDAWASEPCLEGKNHEDVNNYWKAMNWGNIFDSFCRRKDMEEWSGFVEFKRLRTDEAYKQFEDESITLLHQDGAHNTEQIVKELELWAPKVKTGGYWVIGSANWGEAVDGYFKLPSFGFELVKDYDGWEVWRKIGEKKEVKKDLVAEFNKTVATISNTDLTTSKAISPAPLVDLRTSNIEFGEQGSLSIAGLDIQPILIYVPDTPEWVVKFEKAKAHFSSIGIKTLKTVPAIYGHGFGIDGTHEYNLDNPNGHHKVGVAGTSLFLTMYMVYNIEMCLPNTHFLFLEGDTRFQPDFIEKLTEQLQYVPKDFDWLFIGHCCSKGRRYRHMGGSVYECVYDTQKGNFPAQYPMGGNCYIVAKKALPKIIETQRDAYAPVDISMALHTLPHLKTYIIRPRMVEQENNNLPQ